MFDNVFSEIAAVLLTAALIGAVAVKLRQPLIVSFIAPFFEKTVVQIDSGTLIRGKELSL